VLLYRDQKFIPETVCIRPDQVNVTEWESMYSSAFSLNRAPFSAATFSPIVDDSLKVVGHVGWADGNDIIVPEHTIRNNRLFWSLLQEKRLDDGRQRLLELARDDDARWDRFRPFSPFSRPIKSAPAPKDARSGPEIFAPRPHTTGLETRWDAARRGPLKDKSTEETYRLDLDLFVTGGGNAFVGRHLVRRGDASYLAPAPGVMDGRIDSPKKPFSSGYEFLVLVDPEGRLQRVMGVRKNLYSHADLMIDSLELALTVSMLLDIVPIAVVLLRAGIRIATDVMIYAVRSAMDRAAKELVELTLEELAAVMGGAMSKRLSLEEMIAHLTHIVQQNPWLRRLMAARVLTGKSLIRATIEALGDWTRATGHRIVWKTQAEMVKVTRDVTNLMTLQGNELWINREAEALKEAQKFYDTVVHELASDSLGYRGRGPAKRFMEMRNGMPYTDQTLLEHVIKNGEIEREVRFLAGR